MGVLKIIYLRNNYYYLDEKLKELRGVNNPFDIIPLSENEVFLFKNFI